MVKHIQLICQQPTNWLSVIDHFGGLALKGLNLVLNIKSLMTFYIDFNTFKHNVKNDQTYLKNLSVFTPQDY